MGAFFVIARRLVAVAIFPPKLAPCHPERSRRISCLPCVKGGGFCEAKDGGIVIARRYNRRGNLASI